MGMKGGREGDVLKACLEYLRLRQIPAWRTNSGAARFAGAGGRTRFVRFSWAKGCADILGVLPRAGSRTGVFLSVEVKRPGGRLTPAQEAFAAAVRKAGGVALVVKSVGELVEELERLGG